MDIATQKPVATYDGQFVTVSVQSGSKLIELALNANQAMGLAMQLKNASQDAFEQQADDNIIHFQARCHAD